MIPVNLTSSFSVFIRVLTFYFIIIANIICNIINQTVIKDIRKIQWHLAAARNVTY